MVNGYHHHTCRFQLVATQEKHILPEDRSPGPWPTALGMRAPARLDAALERRSPCAQVRVRERGAKRTKRGWGGGRGRARASPALPPASASSSLPLSFSKCSFTLSPRLRLPVFLLITFLYVLLGSKNIISSLLIEQHACG